MKKYIGIGISVIAFVVILLVALKFCTGGKTYTQAEFEQYKAQEEQLDKAYQDTIEFIKGQQLLQEQKYISQQEKVWSLENSFDSLYKKHQKTKEKLKEFNASLYKDSGLAGDTNFTLAPQEYITECEQCFEGGKKIKAENAQLKFERDSYDKLLRSQSAVDSNRIAGLIKGNTILRNMLDSVFTTGQIKQKVKISAIGMYSDPFLLGAGGGFIYEDKKENAFGGHVIFTNKVRLYLINYAKTISFKRKK